MTFSSPKQAIREHVMTKKKAVEHADSDEGGWGDMLNTVAHEYDKVRQQKKDRALKAKAYRNPYDPGQTSIKEFEEGGDKMSHPQTGELKPMRPDQLNAAILKFPKQGNNMATRGTQMSQAPTAPTQNNPQVAPTGGVTPLGNNRGPEKQVKDNLVNNYKRGVQHNFNTGPNKGAQEKGLEVYNLKPDQMDRGPVGNFFNKVGSTVRGWFQEDMHVGMGIETAELFGKSKKPVEVACNDNKDAKFVSSEDKKWMQKAVPKSHEGRFTEWSKKQGYSGVTAESIAAGKKSDDPHVRKMAQLAETFRKHGGDK